MSIPYTLTVDGTPHRVELLERTADSVTFSYQGVTHQVVIGSGCTQVSAAGSHPLPVATAPLRTKSAGAEAGVVRAPMPGLVVAIKVKVGDTVTPSDTVAVIEAMKMENNLTANCAGTVKEIHATAGKEVENRALLVTITPA